MFTPGKNEKRYLAGALDAKSGRLTHVEANRKTSGLFILLLWKLVKEHSWAARIHIVLDNYRIHTGARTQLALAVLGDRVRLHFLPPCCPDHNWIERFWKDLHDNVTRNPCCPNKGHPHGRSPPLLAPPQSDSRPKTRWKTGRVTRFPGSRKAVLGRNI